MSRGKIIELAAADGLKIPAYVAEPEQPTQRAVVVLPEIFGVNSHIRAVVDSYAGAGYLALAPATFERVRAGVELGYSTHDIRVGVGLKTAAEALPPPGVLQDVRAAIDHAHTAGTVALIGFCWGGLQAWRAACTLDHLAAAVVYYGGGMTRPDEIARTPKVPVLAHFAEHDPSIPMADIAAFRQAHPKVAVHTYPAGHGFNCDQRDAWDAPSARLARERTLTFLDTHLC